MKKHVIPILTGIYLFSSAQITYANSSQTRTNAKASVTTTTAEQIDAINNTIVQVNSETVQNNVTIKTTVVSQEELKETAGVLPGIIIYRLERAIEALEFAIASSEEKRTSLKAQYAEERAAEAALLTENVKAVIEEALNTQGGAISDSQGLYAAKKVKEEVKALFEMTEKLIDKAAEYVDESDEKIAELSKQEDVHKEIEVDVKSRNELKIVEEKAREELIKQYEKRIEDKKNAQEKLR